MGLESSSYAWVGVRWWGVHNRENGVPSYAAAHSAVGGGRERAAKRGEGRMVPLRIEQSHLCIPNQVFPAIKPSPISQPKAAMQTTRGLSMRSRCTSSRAARRRIMIFVADSQLMQQTPLMDATTCIHLCACPTQAPASMPPPQAHMGQFIRQSGSFTNKLSFGSISTVESASMPSRLQRTMVALPM